MTATDLRAWITNRESGDPIRVAFDQERDGDCAALLNARKQPGAVHARPLAAVVTDRSLHGSLRLFRDRFMYPDGSAVEIPADFPVYKLVCDVMYILEQPTINLRVPTADLELGAGVMVAKGMISADDRAALLAAATPLSLIQEVFGIDTPDVTGIDVAIARKAGK